MAPLLFGFPVVKVTRELRPCLVPGAHVAGLARNVHAVYIYIYI